MTATREARAAEAHDNSPITPLEVYMLGGVNCYLPIAGGWLSSVVWHDSSSDVLTQDQQLPILNFLRVLPDYYYPTLVTYLDQVDRLVMNAMIEAGQFLETSGAVDLVDATNTLRTCAEQIQTIRITRRELDSMPFITDVRAGNFDGETIYREGVKRAIDADIEVYIVTTSSEDEPPAVFADFDQAEQYAATFTSAGVDSVLMCGSKLGRQMIRERLPKFSLTVKRADGTDITDELANDDAIDVGRGAMNSAVGDLSDLTADEARVAMSQIADQGREHGPTDDVMEELLLFIDQAVEGDHGFPIDMHTPDGWVVTLDHVEA